MTASAAAGITTTQTYNALGEATGLTASGPGGFAFGRQRTLDDGARITRVVEGNLTEDYGYDPAGRLHTVSRNGVETARYGYDEAGNRTSVGAEIATYDARDRLVTRGPLRYVYTAAGELRTVTDARDNTQTTYTYDDLGALTRVDLPGGGSTTSSTRRAGGSASASTGRSARDSSTCRARGGWRPSSTGPGTSSTASSTTGRASRRR